MTSVILITHGPFGSALLESARMIVGDAGSALVLSLDPGEGPSDLSKKLDDALAQVRDNGDVLCLADIPGGTPARTATAATSKGEVEAICGVNLGMLIEVLMIADTMPVSELVSVAVTAGKNSIIDLGAKLREQLHEAPGSDPF